MNKGVYVAFIISIVLLATASYGIAISMAGHEKQYIIKPMVLVMKKNTFFKKNFVVKHPMQIYCNITTNNTIYMFITSKKIKLTFIINGNNVNPFSRAVLLPGNYTLLFISKNTATVKVNYCYLVER